EGCGSTSTALIRRRIGWRTWTLPTWVAGFCVIQAVIAIKLPKISARAKPRGEGFTTETDLESDTVAPSRGQSEGRFELSELAGASNFSVAAWNQTAPRVYSPQQRRHNHVSAEIQVATFGTSVPNSFIAL